MAKNIYVQTALYNNLCDDLRRSLLSLRQSIIFYKNKYNGSDSLYKFWVKYGDASEKKIFDDEQVLNIKKEFSTWFEFEYYFFDENTGTSKGHNILAKNILLESFECLNSDYLLIINPDVVLEYDFFVEILEPFKRLEKVGIVEARQTPLEHPKDYDIKTGETSWAAFACVTVKAKLFKKLNGFDENLFFMRSCSRLKNDYCRDFDIIDQLKINFCPIMSLAFPTCVFKNFFIKFDEDLTTTEDYDFLMRCVSICGVKNIKQVVAIYRKWRNYENSYTCETRDKWIENQNKINEKIKLMPFILFKSDLESINLTKENIISKLVSKIKKLRDSTSPLRDVINFLKRRL